MSCRGFVLRHFDGYNRGVEIQTLHAWNLEPRQAMALQQRLAGLVSTSGRVASTRLVAGVDISAGRRGGVGTAAVVILNLPGLEVVEVKTARGELEFPYVPGLLSFREAPLALAACERLTLTPDLFVFDGQGIAHPRRLGIASHLGLFLNKPTIGCAKSLLCGEYAEPGNEPGDYSEIRDGGEVIGAALRTKRGVKPVFVSPGHRIDLKSAVRWVLDCCRGYRLPEPTRLAHMAAGGNLLYRCG